MTSVILRLFLISAGASLQVCTRNGLQCCTEEYIEEVLNRTGELLPDGVRAELNRTIEIYARIIRRLQNCKTPLYVQVARNTLSTTWPLL